MEVPSTSSGTGGNVNKGIKKSDSPHEATRLARIFQQAHVFSCGVLWIVVSFIFEVF